MWLVIEAPLDLLEGPGAGRIVQFARFLFEHAAYLTSHDLVSLGEPLAHKRVARPLLAIILFLLEVRLELLLRH